MLLYSVWDPSLYTESPLRSVTHCNDVIMSTMASQTTSVPIVYSTVCSGVDQRKHQSSASLAFVRGIHRWSVNYPHKGPVSRKMLPFDDVILTDPIWKLYVYNYCRCVMGPTIWTNDSTIRHIFRHVSISFRSDIYFQHFTDGISFFTIIICY